MPTDEVMERAQEDEREGKSPSTQAGEFVHEEIEHVREGKHGARSTKQAIAIGLSKARRAGVKLPAPKASKTSRRTRRKAQQDLARAGRRTKSPRRSRAVKSALKREGKSAASRKSLSRQARSAAKRRTSRQRSQAAQKASRTRTSRRRRSRR